MFWFCLILGLYPYVIYPLMVWGLARFRPKPVSKGAFEPSITVVIAAFNEADHIESTVKNKLEQEYPADKLAILVVSDGSDDGTDLIVKKLAKKDSRVKLVRQSPRQGKTSGLNLALSMCESELVVFSDANSMYATGTLTTLAKNFNDPSVGYVTGRLEYEAEEGSVAGEGSDAYMRYENWLRKYETSIGSVVGVDGGIDAIRCSLYQPMRPDQLPDFVLPLAVVRQGFRVVYDSEALVTENALGVTGSEYRMRVRVATRALWALIGSMDLLNPYRHGLFAWQLLSHKWLRYLSFIPLGITTMMAFYLPALSLLDQMVQVGFLTFMILSLAGWLLPGLAQRLGLVRWCLYFILLNWASAAAFLNVLRGQRFVTWTPRVG